MALLSHPSRPRNKLGHVSAVALLGLSACARSPDTTLTPSSKPTQSAVTTTQGAIANQKQVLTTFTVLADIARNVAGDKLRVASLTRIGAEIHGYEPTPSDLTKAQKADLILYNGLNLERWLEPFLGNIKAVPSVQVSQGIAVMAIASGPYANKPNPHAWMSPKNALIYVENIRQAFVNLDPDNTATYNANAKAYSAKIQAIDQQLRSNLSQVPAQQRYLVSCEGAFSYLARDYGLKELYLWPINAEQQMTPKQIQTVITQVKTNRIPTVFCETTVSDEGQKQVAKASGARFGGNLYVDSLSTSEGPVPNYLALLDYDVRMITQGLLLPSR